MEDTTVAVFLLNTGQYLIGKYQELDMEPKIYLSDCHQIVDGEFETFPKHMSENSCLLNTNLVLTIGEPSSEILKKYSNL
jgi:hypothetical protein